MDVKPYFRKVSICKKNTSVEGYLGQLELWRTGRIKKEDEEKIRGVEIIRKENGCKSLR